MQCMIVAYIKDFEMHFIVCLFSLNWSLCLLHIIFICMLSICSNFGSNMLQFRYFDISYFIVHHCFIILVAIQLDPHFPVSRPNHYFRFIDLTTISGS